jgi:hypothetical protein
VLGNGFVSVQPCHTKVLQEAKEQVTFSGSTEKPPITSEARKAQKK